MFKNWQVATDADRTQLRVDDVHMGQQGEHYSECVCVVDATGAEDPRRNEWAKLIAAAPDLREAAASALDTLERAEKAAPGTNFQGSILHLKLALAKAEGR